MGTSEQPAIRDYATSDLDAVVALWSACDLVQPWNDPGRDIARKLEHDGGLLLLELDGRVVGSVMFGYEGHRGWVNYLAVDPAWRRLGFGAMLMAEAERRLAQAGSPKANLQVRVGNEDAVAFYRQLGYVADDVTSMGKRLVDDRAARAATPLHPTKGSAGAPQRRSSVTSSASSARVQPTGGRGRV